MTPFKSFLVGLVAFSFLLVSSISAVSEFKIDKNHSYIGFKVKHLGFATVRGQFLDFQGKIVLGDDAESIILGKVNSDSIDTNNQKRDNHLKSKDFFAATLFPEVTFKSKSIKRMNANLLLVTADLTLKDVTKEIVVPFTHSDMFVGPGTLRKTNRMVFESEFEINRKEYNVNFSKAVDGNLVVGDLVTIIIEIEGIEK
jgi:polyisoprenoid-binding protein YceI